MLSACFALLLLLSLPASVMVPKAANNGAGARCHERMPEAAWGFTIEWKWSDLAYTCTYEGRDYRPTGASTKVGLTDLRG